MIQSVDRALRILLALQDERLLGVSDLATRLGLAKGTVHGLLQTLAGRSLVEQDTASGKYTLGPALLVMGNVYLNAHELRVRSLRWVASLNERTGHAVRVGVLVWPDVVVVHHLPARDAGLAVPEVGLGMPAHATCLGKVILAFHPERKRLVESADLIRLTGSTVTDSADLSRELEEAASSGLAEEHQEAVVGESGVAGAVFDAGGRVVGAVSIVVPTPGGEAPGEVSPPVREAARAISRELGASGWPPTRSASTS